jgi:ASC-1-like (ASCH) protein
MIESRNEIEVYPFAYSKIANGVRKIDIRPYYERFHKVQVGDKIDYVNVVDKKKTTRKVTGIALFDDFDTTIKMLPPELIGYENREEIKVRVERMYSKEDIKKHGVCALFIEVPTVKKPMNIQSKSR